MTINSVYNKYSPSIYKKEENEWIIADSDRFIRRWSERKRSLFEVAPDKPISVDVTREYLNALCEVTLNVAEPFPKEKKETPLRKLQNEPTLFCQIPKLSAQPFGRPLALTTEFVAVLQTDGISVARLEENEGKLELNAGPKVANDKCKKNKVIAFSQKDWIIYIGTKIGTTKMWDLEANKLIRCYAIDDSEKITSIKELNAQTLFVGNTYGRLAIYDLRVGKGVMGLNCVHEGQAINAIELTGSNRSFLTGGAFGTIKLWDIRKFIPNADPVIVYKELSGGEVNTLDVRPTNSNLFVAGGDETLSLYSVFDSNTPKITSKTQSMMIWGAYWSSDGKEIVVVKNEGVELYRYPSPSKLKKWADLPMEYRENNFFPVLDPNREKLAIGTVAQNYKILQIWSVFEKQLPQPSAFDLGGDRRYIIR